MVQELTIEEIRQMRKMVEGEILAAICRLESATGLCVEQIDIEHHEYLEARSTEKVDLWIKI